MNWVGGARNRINLHGTKKTQKEFFERKKFNANETNGHKDTSKRPTKKKTVSQDLKAIRTVSKLHDDHLDVHCLSQAHNKRPIKIINLEKDHKFPKIRKIENVDLGPSSPKSMGPGLIMFETKKPAHSSISPK